MATVTREGVMQALLTLLQQQVPGIASYSRRVYLPSEVSTHLQLPALMLYRLSEKATYKADALPPIRHLSVWIVVIIKNDNKKVAGDTILNPILDGIEAALKPSGAGMVGYGTQTLGGLVQWVKVDGEIQIEPGDTDPNGIGGLVVPLSILIP